MILQVKDPQRVPCSAHELLMLVRMQTCDETRYRKESSQVASNTHLHHMSLQMQEKQEHLEREMALFNDFRSLQVIT